MSKNKNYIDEPIEEIVGDRFGRYSKYIIQERALPDARDGLKPVQRRIIFSMDKSNNRYNKPYTKSARVVGDVMGKYHPHGDSSLYQAAVRMSQPWKINHPLIEMHGNNGSIDDDPAAAMRYCVSGDSYISTDNGLIQIRDLADGEENEIDIKLHGHSGKAFSSDRLFDSGIQDVRVITLENGLSITASLNHPIIKDRSWAYASSLELGDRITLNNFETPVWGSNDDLKEARFIALMLNYGVFNTKKQVGIATDNIDHLDMFKDFIKSDYYESSDGDWHTVFVDEDLSDYLKKDVIHKSLMNANRDFMIEFIKTYLDMSVSKSCDKYVNVISNNKELLKNIQLLLIQQLGIYSELNNSKLSISGYGLSKIIEGYDGFEKIDKDYSKIAYIKETQEVVYSPRVLDESHAYISNGMINHNTEIRMGKITEELLEDLDKNTVEQSWNFDDTLKEPTVLPAKFPNLLVNGAKGIAAGYATNIPPHNLNEVIDATIYRIQSPNCRFDSIYKRIKGPDFPTGGIVQGADGIEKAFKTGRNSRSDRILIKAKTTIETHSNMSQIVITEIPYDVIKVNLVKKMDDIRLSGDVDGIRDVRDESGRDGLRIVVDVDKKADPNVILNYLMKNTDLSIYYNYNMVAIVDNRPQQMGVIQLIDSFIAHREEVIRRRSEYDLERLSNRIHIIEGLIKAVDIMDDVIKTIRASKNKKDSENNLVKKYKFTEIQAEAIVALRLYRLTTTDVESLSIEKKELEEEINFLNKILSDKSELEKLMISELREIKKEYGIERKTVIEDEIESFEVDKADLIASEDVMFSISEAGYIKRSSMRSYGASNTDIPGLRDDDKIVSAFEVKTTDTMLIFFENGYYSYLPVYKIDEYRWNDLGVHISAYTKIEAGVKVLAAFAISDFDENKYLVHVTKNGMMKKSKLSDFEVVRYGSAMMAMKLKKDDVVASVYMANEDDKIFIVTEDGVGVTYDLSTINPIGLRVQGVIAMDFRKTERGHMDTIADSNVIKEDDNSLLIVSKQAIFKRIKIEDLGEYGRPAQGERLFRQLKTNPQDVVKVMSLSLEDEIKVADDKSNLEVHSLTDFNFMEKSQSMGRATKLPSGWYIINRGNI